MNQDPVEVEVIDDTPEQDRNRPKRAENTEPDIPDEDEIRGYKGDVQKRIKQLKYEYHEERRQKEEAKRTSDEAVAHAQRLVEENKKLRKTLDDGESVLVEQAKGRVDAQLAKAKQEYKDAFDRGDTEAIVEANEKLSRLSVEAESLRRVTEQKKRSGDTKEEPVETPTTNAQPQQPAQPDPRAQDWAAKNTWFGQDQGLTFAAFGIHRELMEEGYDGATDEYYQELDSRLSKFGITNYNEDQEQVSDSPVQRVASPTRQAKNKNARSKTVKLTQSQVAIAKKLNVPLEEYAKYVKTQ